LQIDQLGIWTLLSQKVIASPNGLDASGANGHRFGDGKLLVNRDDLAAVDDEVGLCEEADWEKGGQQDCFHGRIVGAVNREAISVLGREKS
jgi:hypothetical protein